LSPENVKLIEFFFEILEVPLSIFDATVPPDVRIDSRISIAAYGRLWMAENLKADFVYLDADSLALQGWQDIFKEIQELKSHPESLLGAKAAQTNNGLNWESNESGSNLLCFHPICLVISWDNWRANTKKFGAESWYSIAKKSSELNLLAHDQDILQFRANGDFLHLR